MSPHFLYIGYFCDWGEDKHFIFASTETDDEKLKKELLRVIAQEYSNPNDIIEDDIENIYPVLTATNYKTNTTYQINLTKTA